MQVPREKDPKNAGKGIDKDAMRKFEVLNLNYPRGCIIAKAKLTDCVPVTEGMKEELREKNFLIYSGTTENQHWNGYGFKLDDIKAIEPMPICGMLGLWEYNPEAKIGDSNENN